MSDGDRILRAALHLSNGQLELLSAADELSLVSGDFDNTLQEIRKTVIDLDKSSGMLRKHITGES